MIWSHLLCLLEDSQLLLATLLKSLAYDAAGLPTIPHSKAPLLLPNI